MMRAGVFILIIFSYLFFFPLVKKTLIFGITEKIYYKVKSGDHLGKISSRYNIPVKKILEWNKIKNPDKLLKGQRLVLFRSVSQSHSRTEKLEIGQSIRLKKPVDKWQILKGFRSYGDSVSPGILCKLTNTSVIRPAISGKIVRISQLRGYGKYILIDHGNGWHSMYSNLERIQVRLGQHVSLSDTIGNVKDKKLFFLLAYNGKPVNPMGYFKR